MPRRPSLGAHPNPPRDFNAKRLPLVERAGPWWRIHCSANGPLFFGKTGQHRFDAPAGEYGVLYVGEDDLCAFIETFGHKTGVKVVEQAELDARSLAIVESTRPLRFVDLTSTGLARLGADNRLTTGGVGPAQRWSLALHEHPDQPDGVLFRSRHDPGRGSVAIFDRAASLISVRRSVRLGDAAQASVVANMLDTYDFGLII